jgi:hypothetical protein
MRVKEKFNIRVEVEPDDGRWVAKTERELMRDCEEIADQIKRHVDGVRYVSVQFDVHEKCEHCGSNWTENGRVYNGGCCDADHAPYAAAEAFFDFVALLKTGE